RQGSIADRPIEFQRPLIDDSRLRQQAQPGLGMPQQPQCKALAAPLPMLPRDPDRLLRAVIGLPLVALVMGHQPKPPQRQADGLLSPNLLTDRQRLRERAARPS